MTDQNDQAPQVAFDSALPHHHKPRLRKVRGFPLQAQGPDGKTQPLLGLADAQQISDRMIATLPAAQFILPLMDGTRTTAQIITEVGRGLNDEFLHNLVAQLDGAGLLFGPTFDALLVRMKQDFDSVDHLPPGASAQFAEALAAQELGEDSTEEARIAASADKLREAMDQWIDQALAKAPNPSLDRLPRAIVAPHIDYPRGWINYGSVWGRLRVTDRPDRVIILGTNHFGQSTGVCGCDKGFASPLGICEVDQQLITALRSALGPSDTEKLFENRFDHEREHSIELQIPWIQHCLGKDDQGNFCKVFGALIHDPAVNNGDSYDGQGLALDPFIAAMKNALATLPGKTLIVASADLSHVGPAFGDRQVLAGDEGEPVEFRNRVAQHDQEMLSLIKQGKADDLIASMAWQQNPTRWCSTGCIVAAIKIIEPQTIEVLSYAAAMDQQGASLVSHAALTME